MNASRVVIPAVLITGFTVMLAPLFLHGGHHPAVALAFGVCLGVACALPLLSVAPGRRRGANCPRRAGGRRH